MINLYQALGIPPTATAEQIQAAIEQAKATQKVPSVYLEKSQEWLLNSYIRTRYDDKLREEHPEAFSNLSEPTPAEKKKPAKPTAKSPKPLVIQVPDIDPAFQERLHAHSEHIQRMSTLCTTEETTKQALILPLLDILGFSAYDPRKVKAEYQADFKGVKSGERVDYALFCDGKPVMFIEAKAYIEDLDNHCPQLARYFNATPEVSVCAITNGKEWRFFTDLNNKNIMDDDPFLTIDITTLNELDIAQLYQFRHDQFQPEALRSLAEESVYLSAFTEAITTSLKEADTDFIRYIATRARVQRTLTQKFLESMQPLVKQAIQTAVSSMVVSGLNTPAESTNTADEDFKLPIVDPNNSRIVTTYAERQVLAFTQSILPDDAEIEAKDTETYYNILAFGKANRWILRYFDNKKRPSVIFPIQLEESDIQAIERNGLEMQGEHIIIDIPENIFRLSWLVRESYAFCCDDENFRRRGK